MKPYKQAPLPFIGQKRNFLKITEKLLKENIPNQGEGWTIVDCFGGSGLLAHNAKVWPPQARVIYNDFDDYQERIKHIGETEELRQAIFDLLDLYDCADKKTKLATDKIFGMRANA